eukprot:8252381-Pyramimonas_sp.AAC.1
MLSERGGPCDVPPTCCALCGAAQAWERPKEIAVYRETGPSAQTLHVARCGARGVRQLPGVLL